MKVENQTNSSYCRLENQSSWLCIVAFLASNSNSSQKTVYRPFWRDWIEAYRKWCWSICSRTILILLPSYLRYSGQAWRRSLYWTPSPTFYQVRSTDIFIISSVWSIQSDLWANPSFQQYFNWLYSLFKCNFSTCCRNWHFWEKRLYFCLSSWLAAFWLSSSFPFSLHLGLPKMKNSIGQWVWSENWSLEYFSLVLCFCGGWWFRWPIVDIGVFQLDSNWLISSSSWCSGIGSWFLVHSPPSYSYIDFGFDLSFWWRVLPSTNTQSSIDPSMAAT